MVPKDIPQLRCSNSSRLRRCKEHQANSYTQQENFDWAFCTPVRGDACKSWGIYATGRSSGDASATLMAPWAKNELGGDLKFAELVAAILSSLRVVVQTWSTVSFWRSIASRTRRLLGLKSRDDDWRESQCKTSTSASSPASAFNVTIAAAPARESPAINSKRGVPPPDTAGRVDAVAFAENSSHICRRHQIHRRGSAGFGGANSSINSVEDVTGSVTVQSLMDFANSGTRLSKRS